MESAGKMMHALTTRLSQVVAAVGLGCALLFAAPLAKELWAQAKEDVPVPSEAPVALSPFAEGDLIAQLAVPRIGVSLPVREGIGSRTLARAAGHAPQTPLPGDPGGTRNCLIAIPRDSRWDGLSELRLRDTLELKTPFGVRRYRVIERSIVTPGAIPLKASASPRVTLVLAYPPDALGPAPYRLAVVAAEEPSGPVAAAEQGWALLPLLNEILEAL